MIVVTHDLRLARRVADHVVFWTLAAWRSAALLNASSAHREWEGTATSSAASSTIRWEQTAIREPCCGVGTPCPNTSPPDDWERWRFAVRNWTYIYPNQKKLPETRHDSTPTTPLHRTADYTIPIPIPIVRKGV